MRSTAFSSRLLIGAIAAMTCCVAVAAQPNLLITSRGTLVAPNIYLLSEDGQTVTTLVTPPIGWVPTWFTPARNNRGFTCAFESLAGNGMLLDVDKNGVVTSATSLPGVVPRALWASSDGGWLIETTGASYHLDASGLTTLPAKPLVVAYGRGRDEETGEWILKGQISQSTGGFYRFDPYTGSVSLFWTRQQYYSGGGSNELPYHVPTGGVLELDVPPGQPTLGPFLAINTAGNTQTTLWAPGPIGVALRAVTRARAGRTVAYHIIGEQSGQIPRPLFSIRLASDGRVLGVSPLPPSLVATFSKVAAEGSRPLSWHMVTPPNGRRMLISAPRRPGASYVAVFSLSGVRPGVPIGSRRVPIVLDGLSNLCLAGGIPGVIQNTMGTLSTTGEASVTFDTNSFGSALRGVRAWGAAVVLDPQAPNGVSHILGPLVLNIRR